MLLTCFGSAKRALPNVVQQFRMDHVPKRRKFRLKRYRGGKSREIRSVRSYCRTERRSQQRRQGTKRNSGINWHQAGTCAYISEELRDQTILKFMLRILRFLIFVCICADIRQSDIPFNIDRICSVHSRLFFVVDENSRSRR